MQFFFWWKKIQVRSPYKIKGALLQFDFYYKEHLNLLRTGNEALFQKISNTAEKCIQFGGCNIT